MTREEAAALFARVQDAHKKHDAVGLSAFYAEDCVIESPMAGGTVRGRQASEELSRAWFSAFPDVALTTESLLVDGEQIAWFVSTEGTDAGSFMGLPPTNKPFRFPMVLLYTLKDGKIAHERRIYDFTGMLVQIGVLKARPK